MRALILAAGALALSACSNNDQHDNTMNVDENLTAENIVSNDVTAIDAVTGDDANMAESAEINDFGPPLGNDSNTTSSPAKPSAARTETATSDPKKAADSPKPSAKPVSSTTTTAANTTE